MTWKKHLSSQIRPQKTKSLTKKNKNNNKNNKPTYVKHPNQDARDQK